MDSLLYLWYEFLIPLFYTFIALSPIFVFYLFMRLLLKVTRQHQVKKKPGQSKDKMSSFLPDTPAKGQKQIGRKQKKQPGTSHRGKRSHVPGHQSGGHAKKPQLSDFAALSKKWQKKAAETSPSSPPKKPAARHQQAPVSPKRAKKEPLQAKKASISPHKTRLQSRYADRSINIQVENLDGQNQEGRQGVNALDLRNVREGVVWQVILEAPKAYQK